MGQGVARGARIAYALVVLLLLICIVSLFALIAGFWMARPYNPGNDVAYMTLLGGGALMLLFALVRFFVWGQKPACILQSLSRCSRSNTGNQERRRLDSNHCDVDDHDDIGKHCIIHASPNDLTVLTAGCQYRVNPRLWGK